MKTEVLNNPKQYTEIATGVIVMKNNKAWGEVYSDGRSTSYGWVNPTNVELNNSLYCTKPTDLTYTGSPYEAELSTAELLKVERKVILTVIS